MKTVLPATKNTSTIKRENNGNYISLALTSFAHTCSHATTECNSVSLILTSKVSSFINQGATQQKGPKLQAQQAAVRLTSVKARQGSKS